MYEQKARVGNEFKKIVDILCKKDNAIKSITHGYKKEAGQWKPFFMGFEVPYGIIVPFEGSLSEIPKGWVLCDGTNGTPNLAERFIIGARQDNLGETGGSNTHTHTTSADGSHTHTMPSDNHKHELTSGSNYIAGDYQQIIAYGDTHKHTVSAATHTHTLNSTDHLPKYYTLAFIMKI